VEPVVERIRKGIFSGDFPPEAELPAAEKLAETRGLSSTVVREAVRTLRSRGLVGRRAVLSALVRGDPEAARRPMQQHLAQLVEDLAPQEDPS
jgi:DNA-binding FadR family transcriptional regulator